VLQDFAQQNGSRIGFKDEEEKKVGAMETEVHEKVMEMLRDHFKPEFLNRIDETIIFHGLLPIHLKHIVDIQLELVEARVKEKKITLVFTKEAKELLATKGYDPVYGARPLKRLIQQQILDPLAMLIIGKTAVENKTVSVGVKGDQIKLSVKKDK